MMKFFILHLDAYHLGDPLFIQHLAGLMGRAPKPLPPTLMVHGSGERAALLFEARGLFPEQRGGRLMVRSPAEGALVEHALRDLNRTIVNSLTEAVLPAVGIQGADKSLLMLLEGERIAVGKTGWVETLLTSGVLPVLSTLVYDEAAGHYGEGGDAAVLLALADALGREGMTLVCFARVTTPVADEEAGAKEPYSVADLPDGVLPAPESTRQLLDAGIRVLLTTPRRFYTGAAPRGVYLIA